MDRVGKNDSPLAALARHLAERRETIMRSWRKAVDRDPRLTTGASLPRTQLNDHIPQLLDRFSEKLLAAAGKPNPGGDNAPAEDAAAHGLQRWQQGYDLREVTREWGQLQLCMSDELESYAAAHADLETGVMATARRLWIEICTEGVTASTAQYFHLQQVEATGHVHDLEQALEDVRDLDRQRFEIWREAAHDLRGNMGGLVNATAGLGLQGAPVGLRENFLRLLTRNVSSLHSLLEDVTNLARLQAGQELRQVKAFDASAVLRDLCERMRPMAEERHLFLRFEELDPLQVEGDEVKVQRIAQNLLLNAIKYTSRGGVTVSWGNSTTDDSHRWMLCVQDTGPGFHTGPGAPMAGALEDATDEARHVERAAHHTNSRPESPEVRSSASQSSMGPLHQERGEGIGLSIVKRLCELLNATMEMESEPGKGTTLRILFPRSYGSA